ncbi:MAG TPA: hypothetical protein VF469_28350 [Kofleriaceae bacterium]
MDQVDRPQGPPFYFDGVTARVFPLRAHANALQRLCHNYLNLFPEQIYFRPSAPYVMLVLLNYGRMSYASETCAHYGWVSQNEVYFGVPLDWGRHRNGRWEPLGTGGVAPFIFVDQGWSIEVGREVYGWPKQPCEFQREVNTWASGSPAARETLLTLATETFITPYASERPSSVPLVEIDRAAPLGIGPALWQAPLSLDNPWWGMMTMWREAMRAWSPTGLRDAGMYVPLMLKASRLLFGGTSPLFWSANLKQVRSLEDPSVAAYQAITMSPMRQTALHRAGMLGEGRILLGDPTGGYRIRVQRHPLFPIIETLGLLVSEEEQHSDARDVAIRGYTAGVVGNTRLERFPDGLTSSDDIEHGVATLAPLFPFWLEADLEYGCGKTITWRNPQLHGGVWHRPDAPAAVSTGTTWVADESSSPLGASPGAYDATWGSRGIPAPPYYYPQLTMRVLALPATRDGLTSVIEGWKVPPEVGSFTLPDGDPQHVLMMVTTSEEMGAQTNSAGWWWKRQVSFFVPVVWSRPHEPHPMPVLVSAITFADSQLAAITAREVGPEAIAAELYAPPDSWLDFAGPRADRRLLWLATNVLPAVDVDAEAKQRVVLELLALDQHAVAPGPAAGASIPQPIEIPGEGMRLCIVARRRIRDTDPSKYAYEEWFSQNLISRGMPGHPGWQLSTDPLEVRIHQYPDQLDLVGRLALQVDDLEHGKSRRSGRGWEGATVNIISTGFAWATLDVTQECNTSLAVRSHGGKWTTPEGGSRCKPLVNEAFETLLREFASHFIQSR